MRVPLALVAASLLLLAPAVWAQDDGCLQSNPCLFDVEVDEAGISSLSIDNMTSGDWFYLGVSNLDDRAHTVSFANVAVQVPALGLANSQPFQAPAPGDHTLSDQPTGDTATVHVLEGDVVEAEQSASDAADGSQDDESAGAPGPGLVVVLAAVALAAFAARRRLL